MKSFTVVSVLILFLSHTPGLAQNNEQYLYPIAYENDEFRGSGIDWFLENAKDKTFVLFGEQHGIEGIARFVDNAYQQLSDTDFNHLILETDSWTAQKLNQNGVDNTIRDYPFAIAFDFDEDLVLIDTVLKKNHKVHGVDQLVTAIHAFDRLRELAATSNQKRLANGAFLKATLKMGEYLREKHFPDLEQIESVFTNHPNPEVAQILNELRVSMDIYTTWRAGQRGEVSKRVSPEMREQFMKDKFDDFIATESRNSTLPEAIFKMGGAHILYGTGPNGVSTLGEYVRKKSLENNGSTLAIGISRFHPDHSLVKENDFKHSSIILMDHKNYLAVEGSKSTELTDQQKMTLNGYDATVYFKDASRAAKTIINDHKNAFRSRFISMILPLAIFLLISLSSVVPGLIPLFKPSKRKKQLPFFWILISTIVITVLIVLQVLWILEYPENSAAIIPAFTSLLVFIFFFAISLFHLYKAFVSWKKQEWSKALRIYFSILAISHTGLVWSAFYWNLGGMVG